MLYAFNTLTSIGQVVWSEALGDYMYNYSHNTIGERYTGEDTLGVDVFNLHYVEGIITDNEGNGDDVTTLEALTLQHDLANNGKTAYIKAGTGLELYRHAVRQWYTGSNYANGKAVGVYTHDLATSTVYKCDDSSANKALEQYKKDGFKVSTTTFTVGSGTQYVIALVDNSAYEPAAADIYTVSFNVLTGSLGVRSTVKDTTVIGGNAVDNDRIMTDISSIGQRDPIIYLATEHGAYYVSPVTATSGTVVRVDNSNNITLSDGTVLAQSKLAASDIDAQLTALKEILATTPHDQPNVTFTLDTHGHYMSMDDSDFRYVAYYTGAYNEIPGSWVGEETYVAQFVNVLTGEIMNEVPVTETWVNTAKAGYFDITDALYAGDEVYAPERVLTSDNVYSDEYIIDGVPGSFNNTVFNKDTNTIGGADNTITNVSRNVTFNTNEVTIIVARYNGTRLVVDTYDGVDDMLAKYSERFGKPVTDVNLGKLIAHVSMSPAGNYVADTLFAWDVGTAVGGYLYVDELKQVAWTDSYVEYSGLYLNGSTEQGFIRVPYGTDMSGVVGNEFYRYHIQDNGMYLLDKVEKIVLNNDTDKYYIQDNADGTYSLMDEDTNTSVGKLDANTVIVDLRDGAGTEWDVVETLEMLMSGDYSRYDDVLLTLTFVDGVASPIYVIDAQ